MTLTSGAEQCTALRGIPEFDGVRDVWPRGERLAAVRAAATAYRDRFRGQGQVEAVRSVDIAAAPYPRRYAFHGAALGLNPLVNIVNRVLVVRFTGFDGASKILVWEPTVAAGSASAPFYANLKGIAARFGGIGDFLTDKVFTRYYNEPQDVLAGCGLHPQDVDYVSFDHLHVQDPRMVMGCEAGPHGQPYRPPLFPRARLLAHQREIDTFSSPHPLQVPWYVAGGMTGVPADRVQAFHGDVELGVGVSLLWTPGHTDGNHSLVLNTPDGVWVSSENGVAADSWQPELSRIPGVARQAAFFGHEVVMNANTLEDSLDQYDSMVKEKTLADASPRDPRWLQILPSSEIVGWRRQWPVRPTYTHGGIRYGDFPTTDTAPGSTVAYR